MFISSENNVTYRRFIFSASECFLDGKASKGHDISYYIQIPHNMNGTLSEFPTLLVDLSRPQEVLWQDIYHRTRSEIRSFTANHAYEHAVIPNPPDDLLKLFKKLFNRFAKHKRIRRIDPSWLRAYNNAGQLAVSFIKQQNQFICINIYRVSPQRATNFFSFHFAHELKGSYSSSHFGRAHRALHWLDMLHFKNMQIGHYDFCGLYTGTTDQHLLNVNAFKEQFTRNRVVEYSGVIYHNRLLKLLLKFFRSIKLF